MKKLLNILNEILSGLGQAKYAAELARNGQWERAQSMYRK